MEIEYEVTQRRHVRSASAPSTLMQRMQKAPLIERLGRAETQAKQSFTCVAFFEYVCGGACLGSTRATRRFRGSPARAREIGWWC